MDVGLKIVCKVNYFVKTINLLESLWTSSQNACLFIQIQEKENLSSANYILKSLISQNPRIEFGMGLQGISSHFKYLKKIEL